MSQSKMAGLVAKPQRATTEPKSLGINTLKPKYPQYAVVSKRLESFKSWPDYLPISPDPLVEAGLVYTGVGDNVRCYFCGGGLRNWERDDKPWVEHTKWYPECGHILLVKGQKYIDAILKGDVPEEDSGTMAQPVSETKEEADPLETDAAQSCIQMGFSKELVRRAIKIFNKRHGLAEFKGSDLCLILFELEENPECDNDHLDTVADGGSDVEADEDPEAIEELVAENQRLKETKVCKICLDDMASVIFLPCGHMVSCPMCAPALNKCPMCRVPVKGYVKAFFA